MSRSPVGGLRRPQLDFSGRPLRTSNVRDETMDGECCEGEMEAVGGGRKRGGGEAPGGEGKISNMRR